MAQLRKEYNVLIEEIFQLEDDLKFLLRIGDLKAYSNKIIKIKNQIKDKKFEAKLKDYIIFNHYQLLKIKKTAA